VRERRGRRASLARFAERQAAIEGELMRVPGELSQWLQLVLLVRQQQSWFGAIESGCLTPSSKMT
jgi:hypothetical protein